MNYYMETIEIDNINKYFDTINIIYWINLDRSTERKKNMETILKYLPVKNERISAVDGKNIPIDKILSNMILKENVPKLTNYEYACLLSHLNTIKKFSETNYEYALILEDDTTLEFVKYWNKKISDIINEAPSDWEIILLNYITHLNIKTDYVLVANQGIYSTQAYILKNSSAKEFIKNVYHNNKFDLSKYKNYYNYYCADIYLYNIFTTYCYKYPYFTYPSTNDSTIHDDHLKFHKKSKDTIIKRWENKEHFNQDISNNVLIYLILLLILISFILFIVLFHH